MTEPRDPTPSGPGGSGFAASRLFWVIMAVALAVRLALIVYMGDRYYFGDTPEYDAAARSILSGHGPGEGFPRPPGYPALMALGYLIGGPGNFPVVRLLQLVFGLAVVWLTGRLGEAVGGRRVGLGAAALAAISPTLIFTTGLLYPSVVYTAALLVLTLLARALAERPGRLRAAWFGAATGATWLVSQVVVLPALALGLWFAATRPRRVLLALPALLAAALAVSPWLAYQRAAYGRAGFNLQKADYVMNIARADTAVYGRRAVPSTIVIDDSSRQVATAVDGSATGILRRELHFFLKAPHLYAWDYAREFLHFFQPLPDRITSQNRFNRPEVKWLGAIHFGPLLALALVGLFLGRARRADRLLLALLPLATAALYAFFFTQARYRIPVEPQMTVLAALGVAALVERVRRRARAR